MNDLIVAEKIAEWQRLKTLVLDSVSSPITRRVYNMALDEFIAWYRSAPRPVTTTTLASITGGPRPRFLVDHYPDVSDPEAGHRGGGQRAARARVGGGDHSREECEVHRHPRWELALAAASVSAAQHARYRDGERAPRSCDSSRSPRLRAAAI